MPSKVTLTTKIRFNGREYASVDELPPEARAQYEKLMRKFDANHNGVPDALEADAPGSPPVSVADQPLARLAARLMSPERRARYEAALREADARLAGAPSALDMHAIPDFAAQVLADTASVAEASSVAETTSAVETSAPIAQTPPADAADSDEPTASYEDQAIAWLEGLAAKQNARPAQALPAIPRTPAPTQSPANFPVVSGEPSNNRRWLILALLLFVLLAAGAFLFFSLVGPH
jgi:hypothetical protein